jgi:hypothetical protein
MSLFDNKHLQKNEFDGRQNSMITSQQSSIADSWLCSPLKEAISSKKQPIVSPRTKLCKNVNKESAKTPKTYESKHLVLSVHQKSQPKSPTYKENSTKSDTKPSLSSPFRTSVNRKTSSGPRATDSDPQSTQKAGGTTKKTSIDCKDLIVIQHCLSQGKEITIRDIEYIPKSPRKYRNSPALKSPVKIRNIMSPTSNREYISPKKVRGETSSITANTSKMVNKPKNHTHPQKCAKMESTAVEDGGSSTTTKKDEIHLKRAIQSPRKKSPNKGTKLSKTGGVDSASQHSSAAHLMPLDSSFHEQHEQKVESAISPKSPQKQRVATVVKTPMTDTRISTRKKIVKVFRMSKMSSSCKEFTMNDHLNTSMRSLNGDNPPKSPLRSRDDPRKSPSRNSRPPSPRRPLSPRRNRPLTTVDSDTEYVIDFAPILTRKVVHNIHPEDVISPKKQETTRCSIVEVGSSTRTTLQLYKRTKESKSCRDLSDVRPASPRRPYLPASRLEIDSLCCSPRHVRKREDTVP